MLIGSAHIIAGTPSVIPDVLALLEREGIQVQGNPDVYVREYRQFGIEEARELRERASTRAFKPTAEVAGRVFVVAASSMTTEAQNALLKTLEDSPADSAFFLVVPSPHMLLPTVRSRAQILELPKRKGGEASLVDAKAFLSASVQARLDMLKLLLEKGNDDPSTGSTSSPRAGLGAGKRDTGAIIAFLASLEVALAPKVAGMRPAIEAVYRARRYAGDKGALVKPLLEQVALLSPKL